MLNVNKIYVMPYLKELPNVQQKLRNLLYEENILLFRYLQLMGCCAITRNEQGRFECRWLSFLTIYTIFVFIAILSVLGFSIYCAVINFMYNSKNIEAEDVILYLGITFSGTVNILGLIVFLEVQKVANFLNQWSDFELHFLRVTKKNLIIYPARGMYAPFSLLIAAIAANLVLASGPRLMLIIKKHNMLQYTTEVNIVASSLLIMLMAGMFMLWLVSNKALADGADAILLEIQCCKWFIKDSLDDYFYLWLNLNNLCQQLSDCVCWTFLFLCGSMFCISLPALYSGISGILRGEYLIIVVSTATLAFISLVVEIANKTLNKVGAEFQEGLSALLVTCKSSANQKTLFQFIEKVGSYPPLMSFGGFFSLDRSVNLSLYSNVVTYLIIMGQFTVKQ